jgi:hypothetical protein
MKPVLGKLLRRSYKEWREICLAYGYLLMAWWYLSVRRQRLDHWLLQTPVPADANNLPNEADRRTIIGSARWVNTAARYPRPWAKCLQRSLALCLLLKRRGFNPQLKIGVRKDNDELQAHAWVEYCGRVINDSQDTPQRFTLMNGRQDMPSAQQLSRAIRG